MAVELAPDNIRVVALNPVAGETPLLATFMGGDTPVSYTHLTLPTKRIV